MRIDPSRLLVLDAVATFGSVTGAARHLSLVPSGVSQHLAALERETGVSIIDRSQRGGQRAVRLTNMGRRLASHGARLRMDLEAAETEIALLTEEISGRVSIGAFPTALHHLVLPARRRLAETYGALDVQIAQLDEGPATTAVHAGDIDVILVERDARERFEGDGLVAQHILDDPYLMATPSSWATPSRLTDLGSQPWIEGPPHSVTAAVLEGFRTATGLAFTANHSCLEYPAVFELVSEGLGAALVPDLALRESAPARIKITQLPGLGARSIYAVYPRQRRRRRVIQAVLDALQGVSNDINSSH